MDERYMLILGGGFVVCYGLVSALRLKASARWPRVGGRVVKSEKKAEWTEAGRLEDADIVYEYEFGGKSYTSRVVKIGGDMLTDPKRGGPSAADLLVAKYPAGKAVGVYVNPDHPKVACLERAGAETAFLAVVCGSVAVAAGIYFSELTALVRRLVGGLWG